LLLIKRAKSPNQGLWSFPGGALELGEALVAGAERELSEEVPGLEFERESAVAGGLAGGVAFAAADSIHFEEDSEEEGGEGGREGGGRGEAEEAGSSGGSGEKRRSEKRKAAPRFHWAIVEVAAVAKSSSSSSSGGSALPFPSSPATGDDAAAAKWVRALSELPALEEKGEVTRGCARVAAEAVRRFSKDLGYRQA